VYTVLFIIFFIAFEVSNCPYVYSNDENLEMIPRIKPIVNTSQTYTLLQLHQDIQTLENQYQEMAKVSTIGYSVEGRPILAIQVGLEGNEEKPNILLMGGIHPRENYSVMMVVKQLDKILYHYFNTGFFGPYNLHEILEDVNIYFVPTINPDGMNIIHNGIESSLNYEALAKMRNIQGDYRWWKSNANGVDLNKNFEDGNWSKPKSYLMTDEPSSGGFKGYFPNSEPETRAIQAFSREKQFLLAISYHTSGEAFFWADTDTHANFEGIDIGIINRFHDITGYDRMPVSKNPVVFGRGFENWFKKEFNRLAICVELAPFGENHYAQYPDSMFDELVWEKAKYTGIQLALEATKLNYYDVYQANTFLKTFYSEEKAIAYAKLWERSLVKHQGEK
jgi:hypothetical protein